MNDDNITSNCNFEQIFHKMQLNALVLIDKQLARIICLNLVRCSSESAEVIVINQLHLQNRQRS